MNYLKIKNYIIFLAIISLLFVSKSNATIFDGTQFKIGFCVKRTKPSTVAEEYTLEHIGQQCMYKPLSPDLNHGMEAEPEVLHLTYPAGQESMVCTDVGDTSGVRLKNSEGCHSQQNRSSIMIERDDYVYTASSTIRLEDNAFTDAIQLFNTSNKLFVCSTNAFCDSRSLVINSGTEVWFMYEPY